MLESRSADQYKPLPIWDKLIFYRVPHVYCITYGLQNSARREAEILISLGLLFVYASTVLAVPAKIIVNALSCRINE